VDFDADSDVACYRLPTPTPGTPKASTPPLSPQLAPQGPSQLLTALLVRLSDATNRALIDQAAIDFAFLNSKAARKRLIKVFHFSLSSLISLCQLLQFLGQVPKNRIDLLPHYSRLATTLNRYMPDIGVELVSIVSFYDASVCLLLIFYSLKKNSDTFNERKT
jgi:regulator of nonsense transcripts 2